VQAHPELDPMFFEKAKPLFPDKLAIT